MTDDSPGGPSRHARSWPAPCTATAVAISPAQDTVAVMLANGLFDALCPVKEY